MINTETMRVEDDPFKVKGMHLSIQFDKDIVDWLNINYPIRNWVSVSGPVFYKVGLFADECLIAGKVELPRFIAPADIMWEQTQENIEGLIRKLAEYLMDTYDAHQVIYLHSLHGELGMIGSNTSTVDKAVSLNGQGIRKVGMTWDLRANVETTIHD